MVIMFAQAHSCHYTSAANPSVQDDQWALTVMNKSRSVLPSSDYVWDTAAQNLQEKKMHRIQVI